MSLNSHTNNDHSQQFGFLSNDYDPKIRTELISRLAHDINQPLTAILLFAYVGKQAVESGDKNLLDNIHKKIEFQLLKTNSILNEILREFH